MWYNLSLTENTEDTEREHREELFIIFMLNVSEPLPPRPPVPNVNIDLLEPERRGKRRNRVGRFIFRVVVLAAIVFFGYWFVQQPFFEPVVGKAIELTKRGFNWLKEVIKRGIASSQGRI